ncbi:MAG TPA: NlpC/P60 family protein [Jatrophihabitantaceae bacterium]|jgi:cell wall-associated NlpC family hydrolase
MTLPSARTTRRAAIAAVTSVALAATLAVVAPAAQANPPAAHDPRGRLWYATAAPGGKVRLQGWATDPDTTRNLTVVVLRDGRWAAQAATSVPHPTIAARRHSGPTPGFDITVAAPVSGVHTLCVAAQNVGSGITRVLGCVTTPLGTRLNGAQLAAHSPHGVISWAHASSRTFRVTGWAAEPDYWYGRIVAVLYLDGHPAKTVNTHRASAAQRAAGAGKRGAFDISVPVRSGAHIGCVWAVNTGLGSNQLLGCATRDTRGKAGSGTVSIPRINRKVVREAKTHLGQRYVWGAEGPKKFDCSGLVMYSYHKAGFATPRIAEDQFAAARVIPASRAVWGDLVFYHDSTGYVYHVGIYLRPLETIAAADPKHGVIYQHVSDPTVTYGSFTHT